jgi:hypothetical protein
MRVSKPRLRPGMAADRIGLWSVSDLKGMLATSLIWCWPQLQSVGGLA